MIILCKDCIEAIRSHDEPVFIMGEKSLTDNPDIENITRCEFCDDCTEDETILYICEL